MNRKSKIQIFTGLAFTIAFAVWTLLVLCVDTREIGPCGSSVGFAELNGRFHSLTGENMQLYVITDWLGLVPIAIAFFFAIFGLIEWIKRKSILKVDYSILVLGGFYILVIAVYLFFESVVINYRPVLIDGCLEASYPSSTTMLVTTVMPSTLMEVLRRIERGRVRALAVISVFLFTAFMVVGRIISGVHWITDIIGGALISAGLLFFYAGVCNLKEKIG